MFHRVGCSHRLKEHETSPNTKFSFRDCRPIFSVIIKKGKWTLILPACLLCLNEDDDDGGMKNWKRAENSPREIFASVRARVGREGDFSLKAVPPSPPFLADVAKENGAISAQAIDLILMTDADAVLTRQQSREAGGG